MEDIKTGDGEEVHSGDYVLIHYKGTLENGIVFDSSYERGRPFKTRIGVGDVIEGWDMGVVGMKIGGKRKLIIPPQLAYKDQAIGDIPPNSTLIFELELLGIE
jgi:peptidylprolyl isomerase